MTRKNMIYLAMLGSLGLLLGALAFQYIGAMTPCELCVWQRWPHVVALIAGFIALNMRGRFFLLVGAMGAATSGAIGIYHTGVERKWWEGPTSCTSSGTRGISAEDLLENIMATPLVRCDEVPWEMFTLSMASWNAIISFGLALIWIVAIKARS